MNEKETNRLEAFSDGVFAVAITLLVLNIKVPGIDSPTGPLSEDGLWGAIRDEWPTLVGYVTSFFTVGIMWLNHHRLFSHIRRINTPLVMLNLVLMVIIVFVPVPTALLVEYIQRPNQHAAAIIYSGVFVVLACVYNLLWRYAAHKRRLLGNHVSDADVDAINKQYLLGPGLYLLNFVISWFSTPATIVGAFLLALLFAVPGDLLQRRPRKTPYADLEPQSKVKEM